MVFLCSGEASDESLELIRGVRGVMRAWCVWCVRGARGACCVVRAWCVVRMVRGARDAWRVRERVRDARGVRVLRGVCVCAVCVVRGVRVRVA